MMKRFVLVLMILSLAAIGGLYAAQECGSTAVLSGCVGDTVLVPSCQNSYSATYTVTAADVAASPGKSASFCLVSTSSSLCASTSAIATVTRNGAGAQSADLNDGESIRVRAKEGDVLEVKVEQVARNNGIACFRQGEIEFELVR